MVNREQKGVAERLSGQARNGGAASVARRAGVMAAMLIAASGVGFLFRAASLPDTDIAITYLLAVLITARLTRGYVWGFLASGLAAFAFNYLFTQPYFSFYVDAPSYIVTLAIMTTTAIITSALTTYAKQKEMEARERESETKAIYALTNRLTDASDIDGIGGIATDAISRMLGGGAGCLCFDESGKPERTFVQQLAPEKQIRRETADADAILLGIEGLGDDCAVGEEFCDWPVRGREATLGAVRIPKEAAARMTASQARMLRAMIESVALAMDRLRAAQQRTRVNEEIARERYRGNLLRAISHDLRTPLTGIMGTVEMLLGMTAPDDPRSPLMSEVLKEVNWLHALVENILNLTRLQDGKLVLNRQKEAVEEIVGAAVHQIQRRYPAREIAVHAPEELLLVPMDAKLIGQVLINLLDNAIKHTEPGDEVSVTVAKDDGMAVFTVRDGGEGIEASDLPNLFQMFYTSRVRQADAQLGIGLGLAICDTAVRAHGGSIRARNRADGPGAEFIFALPLEVSDHA